MSMMFATRCNTCAFDLSEYFYRRIINKESIENIIEDITQSCCRIVFFGQFNCVKLYGAPKHNAIIRKSNNDIMLIPY